MLIDKSSILLRANGKYILAQDLKNTMFVIEDETSNGAKATLNDYVYSGDIYTVRTLSKEFKIFDGTTLLTNIGYLNINELYSNFENGMSLMLLKPTTTSYGRMFTSYFNSKIIYIGKEYVKDYKCFNVANKKIIVNSLVCRDGK